LRVATHERAVSDLAAAQRSLDTALAACTFFDSVTAELSSNASFECPVCLNAIDERVALTSCGHRFCETCIDTALTERAKCPMCNCELSRAANVRIVARRAKAPAVVVDAEVNTHGSKLVSLRALLRTLLAAEPTTKIIVFAQFDRLLRLIERSLVDVCVLECVRGSIYQCQSSIDRFRTDASVRVMLLASDATISGVTLVEANHVIAVHTPYDGARDTEREYSLLWQAVGRVRRLGQTRACHLWSLVTEATVESLAHERQRALIALRHPDVTLVDEAL